MAVRFEADVLRLRTALRDLVALSTVPAAWVGREPPAIGAGLAIALSEGLRQKVLDLLFGAEEEFDYSSTTTPATPAPTPGATTPA